MVEGEDDAGVFRTLLGWLEIRHVQVIAIQGTSKFRPAIQAARGYDLQALGLVRDADDSRASAFQSLQAALRTAGFSVPPTPGAFSGGGAGQPRVGALIMPPEPLGTNRALEDVLFASVRNPAVDAEVADYIAFFEEQGVELRDLDLTKARLHAYLGAQDVPGLTIAEAAERGLWNFEHPVFDPIVAFVERVAV